MRSTAFVASLLLGSVAHGAAAAPVFERCANAVAAQPEVYESYRCYYEVASSSGEWQAAAMHLEKLAASHPDIDWIVFMRATVAAPVDKVAAERLYLEAAQRFQAAGNVRGEVLARANLQTMFYQSGRIESAAREVERVAALAERAQDPETRVRARVVESQFFIDTGTSLGRAHRALQQAEADLENTPAYWLRKHVLHGLGSVLLLTGQYDEAGVYFRRLEQEATVQQDLRTIARARLNALNTLLDKRFEEPHAVDATQLLADAEETLVAARNAQDADLEVSVLRMMGEVLMEEQPQRARSYVDACVDKAQERKRSQAMSQCLWIRTGLLADTDPSAAQASMQAAIGLLHHEQGTDHRLLAYAWRHAMRIAWRTQSPEAAMTTGKQALDAIERLRALQPGSESRAAAFSAWAQDYYWLSGRILQFATDREHSAEPAHAARARSLVDEAFQIGERMRARSLLDRLGAPADFPAQIDDATLRRRQTALKAIVEVNRQLLASQGDKAALLRTLASLEREELDAREAQDQDRTSPVKAVSLADVQQSLAANEALLSFQFGARDDSTDRRSGGSWLFAVTRAEARVHELPDRHSLTQSLALFNGLMRQPERRERAGAALYDRLLRQAVEAMPPEINQLIIVPDLPLDTFPVAALSRPLESGPLATHYEIVLVPSATIWHDWRARSAATEARPVLVLADPELTFASSAASQTRSWLEDSGLPLGALPYARAEGREIVRRLRSSGTLWIGGEASEAALKASDLSRYGVLHFAAHTVVDRVNTERSAVLLASGSDQQDGLLQSREIAELRLDGQLIVLSSCQSATGTHVRGEGVLGLARAFFAGGARVVVGSLWPIRDDYAAAFFDPFYVALADGRSVGAAFNHAQRRLIDGGLPMEAWAGFVLIGDGDAVPVKPADSDWSGVRGWSVAAALLLIAYVAFARFRRRHSSRMA
jgi:CHAT domain-containing protein